MNAMGLSRTRSSETRRISVGRLRKCIVEVVRGDSEVKMLVSHRSISFDGSWACEKQDVVCGEEE